MMRTISLDRLHVDLAINQADMKIAGYGLKNDPPKIIYSTAPAILIPIDGPPTLRPVAGEKDIQRVINTSALILFDQKQNAYYLYLTGAWVEACTLDAPWSLAKKPPKEVEKLKSRLEKEIKADRSSNGSGDNTKPPSIKDQFKNGPPDNLHQHGANRTGGHAR